MNDPTPWNANPSSRREKLDVLYAYERRKRADFRELNRHSVWLFLATVSCWSLPVGLIRYAGLGFVLIAFGYELYASKDEARLDENYTMKEAVAAATHNDKVVAAHYRRIESDLFGRFAFVKNAWLYFACFGAWGGSCFAALALR